MPHDPELVAETRAWIARAATDLRAGRVDLDARPPLSADAAFHAQQAAEKAMKAFLTWHGRPFRKTHALIEVGEPCVAIDPSLETTIKASLGLTEFAWRFRYPGDDSDPTRDEAETALGLASDVVHAILVRLPAAVHPPTAS